MSKADDVFVREFLVILGALVLFTVVVFFFSRAIHASALERASMRPAAVAERIAPVGSVQTSAPEATPAKE